MNEPPINRDLDSLWEPFKQRLLLLLERMEQHGFRPYVFEARRSEQRQKWLYGIGRTHSLQRRPVTWTLKSRHLVGKAADVIDRKSAWSDPVFFDVLAQEAKKLGLRTLAGDRCHCEWAGKPIQN